MSLELVPPPKVRIHGVWFHWDTAPKDTTYLVEEDTFTVLSAPPEVHQPSEHPIRFWTELNEAQPLPIGDVVSRGNQLLAIVHDLSKSPSIQPHALKRAWQHAFMYCGSQLRAQLLGSIHGALPLHVCMSELFDGLTSAPTNLKDLWLESPRYDGEIPNIIRQFPQV
ncbi:MAG: hypothetical protein KDC35_12130 [Acidobacteria bacterium]|nr:hypothetical protein [Acidobacteriota bacterium]